MALLPWLGSDAWAARPVASSRAMPDSSQVTFTWSVLGRLPSSVRTRAMACPGTAFTAMPPSMAMMLAAPNGAILSCAWNTPFSP